MNWKDSAGLDLILQPMDGSRGRRRRRLATFSFSADQQVQVSARHAYQMSKLHLRIWYASG
jgi:hypothetical protein